MWNVKQLCWWNVHQTVVLFNVWWEESCGIYTFFFLPASVESSSKHCTIYRKWPQGRITPPFLILTIFCLYINHWIFGFHFRRNFFTSSKFSSLFQLILPRCFPIPYEYFSWRLRFFLPESTIMFLYLVTTFSHGSMFVSSKYSIREYWMPEYEYKENWWSCIRSNRRNITTKWKLSSFKRRYLVD